MLFVSDVGAQMEVKGSLDNTVVFTLTRLQLRSLLVLGFSLFMYDQIERQRSLILTTRVSSGNTNAHYLATEKRKSIAVKTFSQIAA